MKTEKVILMLIEETSIDLDKWAPILELTEDEVCAVETHRFLNWYLPPLEDIESEQSS